MTATVEAIEQSTRKVTLKEPDGSYTMVTAPPEMKRFNELKVGDKVTARYYENIVHPTEGAGREGRRHGHDRRDPRQRAPRPAATVAEQRTITATITQLDREAAVDHVHGAQRLDVQLARRGQEGAVQGQGRRQGRHHVDGGGAGVDRRPGEEVERTVRRFIVLCPCT